MSTPTAPSSAHRPLRWGAGSVACQEFITQLGRNFQVIYEQANSHGQKVQAAGNNMAQTDSAVGSSWA
ncbi:putative ESAT-6-like protein 6 [Mycobacterium marinum]|nr:putative ESAT-6-like protein 6 [Mycobacterium marinum]